MKIRQFVIGFFVGVVVIFICMRLASKRSYFSVQIDSTSPGQHVSILSQKLESLEPNKDGILFTFIRGSIGKYKGMLGVEIKPKDGSAWFQQDAVEPSNGIFVGRIQLGSVEWPIKGGEQYLLRVSAGDDKAIAEILIQKLGGQDRNIWVILYNLIVSIIGSLIANTIYPVILIIIRRRRQNTSQNVQTKNGE